MPWISVCLVHYVLYSVKCYKATDGDPTIKKWGRDSDQALLGVLDCYNHLYTALIQEPAYNPFKAEIHMPAHISRTRCPLYSVVACGCDSFPWPRWNNFCTSGYGCRQLSYFPNGPHGAGGIDSMWAQTDSPEGSTGLAMQSLIYECLAGHNP